MTVYLALSMAVGVLGRSLISPTDPQSLLHVLHLTVDSIPTQNSLLDADGKYKILYVSFPWFVGEYITVLSYNVSLVIDFAVVCCILP